MHLILFLFHLGRVDLKNLVRHKIAKHEHEKKVEEKSKVKQEDKKGNFVSFTYKFIK